MRKVRAKSGRIRAVSKDRRSSAPNVLAQYEKVLKESFTPRERELLRKKGVNLVVRDIDSDDFAASGRYVGRRLGKHTIHLDDSRPMDRETMVHETIHILQEIDPERPRIEKILKGSSEAYNLREALTEAETVSRVSKVDIRNAGYYSDVKQNKSTGSMSASSLKHSDHALFARDKAAAESPVENVHENFFRSKIQYLIDPITGKTARSTFMMLRRRK